MAVRRDNVISTYVCIYMCVCVCVCVYIYNVNAPTIIFGRVRLGFATEMFLYIKYVGHVLYGREISRFRVS